MKKLAKLQCWNSLQRNVPNLQRQHSKWQGSYEKRNPTPVTEKDAIANIREEYTDVVQCAGELSLTVDEEQMARKHERWEKRVRDRT